MYHQKPIYLRPGPSHPHLYVTTAQLLGPSKAVIIILNMKIFLLNNKRTNESLRATIPSFPQERITQFSLRYSTVQLLAARTPPSKYHRKTTCSAQSKTVK